MTISVEDVAVLDDRDISIGLAVRGRCCSTS